jgi:hypothetical protein
MFKVFNDKGQFAGELEINPLQVVMIVPAKVPGELLDANGEPMYDEMAALDLGGKMIVVNDSVEEAKRKIEIGMNSL